MRIPLFMVLLALPAIHPLCAQDSSTNSAPLPGEKLPSASELLDHATKDSADGQLDLAISEATLSIHLDPKNATAYELRGSIYITKKVWDKAERDYVSADKLTPDSAYKYKIAEIHYLEHDYDNARPKFEALIGDPNLGDLSHYKVFMCDLMGSHEDQAHRDLIGMDSKRQPPSFLYSQIAWAFYHGKRKDANAMVAAGAKAYPPQVGELYLGALFSAQRFTPSTATFITKDGTKYDHVHVILETSGLRALSSKGWVTVPIDQLPDDLSGFQDDDMRGQLALRHLHNAKPDLQPVSTVSFTTRSGKTYKDARWLLEDAGLAVLGIDGWIVVPFSDLPADISSFPPEMRDKLGGKLIRSQQGPVANEGWVTFTSKRDRTYDNVRATLTDEGVRVLSNDGWIMVPPHDLPDDLSPFPKDWLPKLKELKRLPDVDNDVKVVTFTTRAGKHYDESRCKFDLEGLHVLGPDGWVLLQARDLSDDLSPFPEEWRARLKTFQRAPDLNEQSTQVITFTTRAGKHYDGVRCSLESRGVRVLGPEGLICVTWKDLPDDLSIFPADWRSKITTGRQAPVSQH